MNNPMMELFLTMATMGEEAFRSEPPKYKTTKEEKACLHCGKLHKSNKAFCSAECFKAYKGKA